MKRVRELTRLRIVVEAGRPDDLDPPEPSRRVGLALFHVQADDEALGLGTSFATSP